jgi:hypothetical protein
MGRLGSKCLMIIELEEEDWEERGEGVVLEFHFARSFE